LKAYSDYLSRQVVVENGAKNKNNLDQMQSTMKVTQCLLARTKQLRCVNDFFTQLWHMWKSGAHLEKKSTPHLKKSGTLGKSAAQLEKCRTL